MDKRSVTAWLLGCKPGELMSFTEYTDHVAVVGPDGRKSYFDNAQLIKGEKAMALELPIGVAIAKKPVEPYIHEMASLIKAPPVSKSPTKKRTRKAS